jgi:hypothetical protein
MKEKTVLVIGNGESRSQLNLSAYQNQIEMIGCNAVYRDFKVDHLICCDKRMIEETLSTHYNGSIYTRERYYRDYKKIKKISSIKLLPELPIKSDQKVDQPEHWGSGPYAVHLASHLNYENIILVGFDLYGNNHLINNVYKGTKNYKDPNSRSVDYSFWMQQIKKVFQMNLDKKFIIFNHADWILPETWKLPNVEFQKIEKFYETIDFHLNTAYN